MPERVVTSLAELTMPQIRAVISKATIKAKGVNTPPPLDLEAIKARADELDPKSQTKADIYNLILALEEKNAHT